MVSIGAFEAKTHLAALLDRVARGEEFTITKHGTPVARLVPVAGTKGEDRLSAIDALKAFSRGQTLGPLKARDLIAEGRR